MTYAKWRQAEMAEAKDLELSTFSIDITPVAGTGVLTSEVLEQPAVVEVIEQAPVVVLSNDDLKAQAALTVVEEGLTNVAAAIVTVTAEAGVSKSKLAQAIFDAHLAEQVKTGVPMSRKAVIGLFMAQAGLTKNGANTYYQNIRTARGLVTAKA